MDHLLFDALKISPIPMETANKATATGWMLEIEKVLNQIIDNANGNLELAQKQINNFLEEYEAHLNELLNDKSIEESFLEAVSDRIKNTIADLIKESIMLITVELDDKGQLVLNIPKQYEALEFSTNTDYDSEFYGCLTLQYREV